jgi:hypothetical protein
MAGLCMPYTFIPDDGNGRRFISTAYRLRSHPDITIWLQDSNGGSVPKGFNPGKFTAEYDNEFFWGQRYQDRKEYRSIWSWPYLRSIKFAGMEGKSSFVELIRNDDSSSMDYGFFAAARGDPAKDPDPTNIQMFVIRDAKNAIAKGMKPLEKDEFIKLAQAVAASVRKRPVTAPRQ